MEIAVLEKKRFVRAESGGLVAFPLGLLIVTWFWGVPDGGVGDVTPISISTPFSAFESPTVSDPPDLPRWWLDSTLHSRPNSPTIPPSCKHPRDQERGK